MPEHTPVPTPSRAVYGFILALSCKIMFFIYLMWALIPENWFRSIGITCLPHRYWVIAIPIFLLTLLALFAFIIYPSLGLMMTPDWNELKTIKDRCSDIRQSEQFENNAVVRKTEYTRKGCYCNSSQSCEKAIFDKHDRKEYEYRRIPKLGDLNPIDVSKHLYLRDN